MNLKSRRQLAASRNVLVGYQRQNGTPTGRHKTPSNISDFERTCIGLAKRPPTFLTKEQVSALLANVEPVENLAKRNLERIRSADYASLEERVMASNEGREAWERYQRGDGK